MVYEQFAQLYDELMDTSLYAKWATYVTDHMPVPGSILELGCGSGQLGIQLAQKGYNVTGLDVSIDMLTLAQQQQQEMGVHFPLIQRDMTDLSGFDHFSAVISFNDSFCYLRQPADLRAVLKQSYYALRAGGVLMFDVHSVQKMESFADYSYHGEVNGQLLVWDSYAGEEPLSCEHDIRIFLQREDGLYERYDECHYERTYPIAVYQELLAEAGFVDVEVTGDFLPSLLPEANRWFFKAVKKG